MTASARETNRVLVGAAAVLALFLVAGAVLLGVSLLHHPQHATGSTAATPSPSALPTQALAVPSASVTASPTASALPTPEQMKDFVVQYLDTATSDQASAWQSLSPRFQAASGGFGSYQRFWGDIVRAEPSDVTASPVDGSVAYRVAYTHRDGRVTGDATRLHLLYRDGRFLIDAEP